VGEPAPVGDDAGSSAPEAIDWLGLERRFPERGPFIDRLAETFLKAHGQTPARLREAASGNDRETIVFLAHSLKGVAGSLLAPRLLAQSRDIEEAGGQESADLGRLALALADVLDEALEAATARLAR
jgi:HPt (histidine-containing phosphotransfer) domain-containing protein